MGGLEFVPQPPFFEYASQRPIGDECVDARVDFCFQDGVFRMHGNGIAAGRKGRSGKGQGLVLAGIGDGHGQVEQHRVESAQTQIAVSLGGSRVPGDIKPVVGQDAFGCCGVHGANFGAW